MANLNQLVRYLAMDSNLCDCECEPIRDDVPATVAMPVHQSVQLHLVLANKRLKSKGIFVKISSK